MFYVPRLLRWTMISTAQPRIFAGECHPDLGNPGATGKSSTPATTSTLLFLLLMSETVAKNSNTNRHLVCTRGAEALLCETITKITFRSDPSYCFWPSSSHGHSSYALVSCCRVFGCVGVCWMLCVCSMMLFRIMSRPEYKGKGRRSDYTKIPSDFDRQRRVPLQGNKYNLVLQLNENRKVLTRKHYYYHDQADQAEHC